MDARTLIEVGGQLRLVGEHMLKDQTSESPDYGQGQMAQQQHGLSGQKMEVNGKTPPRTLDQVDMQIDRAFNSVERLWEAAVRLGYVGTSPTSIAPSDTSSPDGLAPQLLRRMCELNRRLEEIITTIVAH